MTLRRWGFFYGQLTVTRPTKDQIEFAKSMSIKQRRVLWALAIYPSGWFMSASERADPELYELFQHRPSAPHNSASHTSQNLTELTKHTEHVFQSEYW